MPRLRLTLAIGIAVAATTASVVAANSVAAGNGRPFELAIFDPNVSLNAAVRIRAAGASAVRLAIAWNATSPTRPVAGLVDPADPGNPAYNWTAADASVQAAVSAGLEPILDITDAPAWALLPGTSKPGTPDPDDLGNFARAAATRYSGTTVDLPRVRYWQVWNEPNLATQLSPQLVNGRAVGAIAYRNMVNAVATAVKDVAPDNLVVAGGLAPFRDISPDTYRQNHDWGPLSFMRAFFCLSKALKASCGATAQVDIWAHHPYTSGGPTHKAVLPEDVSLGDLPKLRIALAAAVKAHHVLPARMPALWVTEFSWDSNGPDPLGVPTKLLERWVPQALYEMWRNGVSLVTWFQLQDEPLATSFYQSGLFYRDGRKKPYLEGFRFPLVAFPRANGIYVWGRTPGGKSSSVIVEQRSSTAWRRIGRLQARSSGVFTGTLRAPVTGWVRARAVGETTLPFSLQSVADRFFNPFGNPTLLEPGR